MKSHWVMWGWGAILVVFWGTMEEMVGASTEVGGTMEETVSTATGGTGEETGYGGGHPQSWWAAQETVFQWR